MTSEELLESLKKDVYDTEAFLRQKENITIKGYLAHILLKTGIAIKYALPFLVALSTSLYIHYNYLDNTLFIDKVTDIRSCHQMITSTGLELTTKSYDTIYDDNTVKHTTKWTIDENGLYSRVETTYDIENEKKFMDLDFVKNVTKEELDELLPIDNVEIIRKKQLGQDDLIYNNDMIMLNYSYMDYDDTRVRNETDSENFTKSINIILMTLLIDGVLRLIIVKTIDKRLENKLDELKIKYKVLNSKEYSELLNILNLKKENLNLIMNDNKVKKLGGKHE